jgi:hypothetical protein
MTYEHKIYDEDDKEHIVYVDYDMTPYRAATWTEPPEGGCQIISVKCETKELSKHEIDEASEEAVRYSYDLEREGKWGFL